VARYPNSYKNNIHNTCFPGNNTENEEDKLMFPEGITYNKGGQETLFNLINPSYSGDRKLFSFRGGLASGKTWSGACYVCYRALQDPDQHILISANSYGQLETSTLVGLCEFISHFNNIKIEPSAPTPELTARRIANSHYCLLTINNKQTFCYVLSAEAFTGKTTKSKEVGRGLQVRTFWGDEFAYAEQTAINTILGRLGRGVGKIKGLGLITSTINRNHPFNWFYDYFDSEDRSDEQSRIFESIKVATDENLHLDSDYIPTMRAGLTPELYAIEIKSEYVAITVGKIFKYFNREKHLLDININKTQPIHIVLDFNWNPATCLISQYIDNNLVIIKEYYLPESDTFLLIDEVCKYLLNYKQQRIFIHGDASGNQRTANSQQTNWQIVWNSLRKYELNATRAYPNANPSIIDSVNSVNTLFNCDRLFVNPLCRELIKDLEGLQWKKDQIYKSDIKRSHEGDILRYLAHDLAPYNPGTRSVVGAWI